MKDFGTIHAVLVDMSALSDFRILGRTLTESACQIPTTVNMVIALADPRHFDSIRDGRRDAPYRQHARHIVGACSWHNLRRLIGFQRILLFEWNNDAYCGWVHK